MGARISTSKNRDPSQPSNGKSADELKSGALQDAKKSSEPSNTVVAGTSNTVNLPLEQQQITYDTKGVIKTHYNLLKTNLYKITAEENNDIRVARSNTYYYKKYKMESNVFIYIIVVCIIINILTFLHKTYPYFDDDAYKIIVGSILGISIVVVFYVYLIILNKDNLNFDENDYGTNNSKITGESANTGYVEASFNDISNCLIKDPKNVANTNFLQQLF